MKLCTIWKILCCLSVLMWICTVGWRLCTDDNSKSPEKFLVMCEAHCDSTTGPGAAQLQGGEQTPSGKHCSPSHHLYIWKMHTLFLPLIKYSHGKMNMLMSEVNQAKITQWTCMKGCGIAHSIAHLNVIVQQLQKLFFYEWNLTIPLNINPGFW